MISSFHNSSSNLLLYITTTTVGMNTKTIEPVIDIKDKMAELLTSYYSKFMGKSPIFMNRS